MKKKDDTPNHMSKLVWTVYAQRTFHSLFLTSEGQLFILT